MLLFGTAWKKIAILLPQDKIDLTRSLAKGLRDPVHFQIMVHESNTEIENVIRYRNLSGIFKHIMRTYDAENGKR